MNLMSRETFLRWLGLGVVAPVVIPALPAKDVQTPAREVQLLDVFIRAWATG